MTGDTPPAPLIHLADIAEIELFILKRMRELTLGDHASVFHGAGFNFVGLRDWQPGDRMSAVDWAQSSLTNFSPLVAREFEQDSTGTVIVVADASLSTRCGVPGALIATGIVRSVAAIGLSAVLCQDMFGLITFDDDCRQSAAVRPRVGKPHVLHCLDLYQHQVQRGEQQPGGADVIPAIVSQLRKTTLVPVISDFLFTDAPRLIRELSALNGAHDVFLVMVDARFAYQLSAGAAGWIETSDVETGRTRILSRHELARLSDRIEAWQDDILRLARDSDLDILRVGMERGAMERALVEFTAERRLRKH